MCVRLCRYVSVRVTMLCTATEKRTRQRRRTKRIAGMVNRKGSTLGKLAYMHVDVLFFKENDTLRGLFMIMPAHP